MCVYIYVESYVFWILDVTCDEADHQVGINGGTLGPTLKLLVVYLISVKFYTKSLFFVFLVDLVPLL